MNHVSDNKRVCALSIMKTAQSQRWTMIWQASCTSTFAKKRQISFSGALDSIVQHGNFYNYSKCATAEIKVAPWCSILDSGICYFVFRDKIYDNKNNCSTIQRAAQQRKIQVNRILYNVLESSMEHTLFTVPDNEASNWMLLVVNYAVNEWCANWFMYVQPQNDFMNHRNFWQTLWRMDGHLSNNHRHNNPISSLTN